MFQTPYGDPLQGTNNHNCYKNNERKKPQQHHYRNHYIWWWKTERYTMDKECWHTKKETKSPTDRTLPHLHLCSSSVHLYEYVGPLRHFCVSVSVEFPFSVSVVVVHFLEEGLHEESEMLDIKFRYSGQNNINSFRMYSRSREPGNLEV